MTRRETLAKLLRMPAGEVAGRARMEARRRADRVRWRLRPPTWRRADLADALSLDDPAAREVRAYLAAGDWTAAQTALTTWLRTRPPLIAGSAFAGHDLGPGLAPGARERVVRLITEAFPHAARDATARADAALAGRLDVLGYRDVSFAAASGPPAIDWHRDPIHGRRAAAEHWTRVPYLDPSVGDHKVVWELNRHQHWLALGRAWWLTGERRYRDGVIAQLDDWMRANPPETGINWASMLELALRSISWVWALHFFAEAPTAATDAESARPEPPWLVDLLLGLDRQLSLVARNLSTYFSPNTHLLGEALALYVVGRCLPILRRAPGWAARGRAVLAAEVGHQINGDGGHAELSLHYHRYTLDFYLLALAVARATGDAAAEPVFREAASRLARFARVVADDSGRLPRIGDDDGGMLFPICGSAAEDAAPSLQIAALLLGDADLAVGPPREEPAWACGSLIGAAAGARRPPSTVLADSGYAVSRTARGDHLVMDAGPLGFRNGGHAHADALSVVLTVAGRPLFVDPGTATYTMDAERRDRFRSTAYHNTAIVDGRWQSSPAGPFQWSTAANARLTCWHSHPSFDFAEATHDGYGPGGHARQVFARAGCWVVVDWVRATHEAAVHWHLDPGWTAAAPEDGRLALDHRTGARVWLLAPGARVEVIRASPEPGGLGWCSPAYGAIVAGTSLRLTPRGGPTEPLVTIVTDVRLAPGVGERQLLGCDEPSGLALRWHPNGHAETLLVSRPGLTAGRRSWAGIGTDARWLAVREDAARGCGEAWLVDGCWIDSRWVRLEAPSPVTRAHLRPEEVTRCAG